MRVCVLASGSAANAILVEGGSTRILVDAGLPARATHRWLGRFGIFPARLDAILLTHEHDDHARGAGAVARTTGAVVLANERTLRACAHVGRRHERFENLRSFRVGELLVEAIPVSHDAADPVAFVIEAQGKRVVIATDLGGADEVLLERAAGADLVLLEANYDLGLLAVSPYPTSVKRRLIGSRGHLSNDAAARLSVRLHTGTHQRVVLVHLSAVNNLAPLARDVVAAALRREGIDRVAVEAIRPNTGGMGWRV
ncbi:MAG: MBL fold metallo-hydrolase [Armatimonadota bacterium]|nr:MBL fold metallo-hydrolase [Armatimonadota bacterium]MDR7570380.1 MBL fold metallo-hydrolase [Armatimonadota bacterium]MDR7613789.1 MBL fold metallo-hydrolase [Armatimonadota bacterium]